MSTIKTVILEPENHVYLKRIAYINETSIQHETNKIISNKRKEDE